MKTIIRAAALLALLLTLAAIETSTPVERARNGGL
jgi:predicted small lipoprotein YifL